MASDTKMDTQEKFTLIHQRLTKLGVTKDQLLQLSSFKKLQKLTHTSPKEEETLGRSKLLSKIVINVGYFLAVALSVLFLFMLLYTGDLLPDNPRIEHVHKTISQIWMDKFFDADIDNERCLVDVPETLADMFRPPVDCEICQNVTEVRKVSSLSPEEFEKVYAYSARPVVVTDGMANWTAQQALSFDFFKDIYGENSPVIEGRLSNCQFFPYRTKFQNVREVFEMAPERANLSDGSAPWYIGWSNCDSSAANVLRQHYHRPYFLPSESESSNTDWIFMGSPGYGAHMHIDDVDLPSWQAQVRGHKKWTLEPPPECYLQCKGLEVEVHPGEIIVLDTNKWFHQTLIIGDEMSITIGSEYD